jgi:hypothetical protein
MSYYCLQHNEDNVYLNVIFQNNPDDPNLETIAEYNVTKTQPIIDKPSNYYVSVIRFDVPLNGIPLFIAPIIPNQPNPNLTPLEFGINGFTTNVIYKPDNYLTPPIQNQPKQVITPYYFVYSFQNFITSFNDALLICYNNSGQPGGAGPPFFVFDPPTQLIYLIVPIQFVNSFPSLTINQYTANYLEGFRLRYLSSNLLEFVLENTNYNGFSKIGQNFPVQTPPKYLVISQEYPCMDYWLSLRKIVLISNTIPIHFEYIPAFDSITGAQTSVTTSLPILTDFVPNVEYPKDARSIAVYNPLSQYRLIDLKGENPIYSIDLKIYWQDKLGNYYPLYIQILQQASVKIVFLKKNLYLKN